MPDAPMVTCLCPTYGRFERLRDAVACFLVQDYPAKELLILNDAPEPVILCPRLTITADQYLVDAHVRVINRADRYETLGHKRQALLEAAWTPLVAHWDDDDLYMPWHIGMLVNALAGQPEARCAKPRAAWLGAGPREAIELRGIRHNVFEGQMLFTRAEALALGGYAHMMSGQARHLLKAFGDAGLAYLWSPPDARVSYVYRWADGLGHVSGMGNGANTLKRFGQRNDDFGEGRPLIEGDNPFAWARHRLENTFKRLASEIQRVLGDAQAAPAREALVRATATPSATSCMP